MNKYFERSFFQSTRQIITSVLCFLSFCIFSQGNDCFSAVEVTTGTYFSDGPFFGFGASGIPCGEAFTGPVINADWYLFIPQMDGIYTITSTIDPGATDTRLKLWDGSLGCNALMCYGANDDGGFGSTSLLSICLSAGTPYYLEWDDRWSMNGFLWQITLDDQVSCSTPGNDICSFAEPISIGTSVQAFTPFASNNNPDLCGDVQPASSGGIWFSIVGNGDLLTATTCMPETDYDTQISIFSGDCSNLVCLAGNDDQGGLLDSLCDGTNISLNTSSTLTWNSQPGVEYLIYVNGYEDREGHVELLITDASGPCPQIGTMKKVNTLADTGPGSLRETIYDACNKDTITFNASLAGDTIALISSEILINKDLIIIGTSPNIFLSGELAHRIFRIFDNRSLTLQALTLINGVEAENGGAIYNQGTLKLKEVSFENNFESVIPKGLTNKNQVIISSGSIVHLRQ